MRIILGHRERTTLPGDFEPPPCVDPNKDCVGFRFRTDVGVWAWLDILSLLLMMDLAMYLLHRAAHHPMLFPWMHRLHHEYDRPRPLTLFIFRCYRHYFVAWKRLGASNWTGARKAFEETYRARVVGYPCWGVAASGAVGARCRGGKHGGTETRTTNGAPQPRIHPPHDGGQPERRTPSSVVRPAALRPTDPTSLHGEEAATIPIPAAHRVANTPRGVLSCYP